MSELYSNLNNYKVIIIGRSAVGKSTLLLRYVDDEFNPQKPTVGIDYRFKKVSYSGTEFNLELWDSAGQERYRTIVYNYFKLSKAACIVFDITNEESLTDAKIWLQQLVLHCGNEIPKIILANKADLLDPVKLKETLEKMQTQINELKREYHCELFVVSAYSGENVNKAFNYLIKEIYEKNKIKKEESGVKSGFQLNTSELQGQRQTGKKDRCC